MIKRDKHKPLSKKQDLVYTSFMIIIGDILMAFAFVFFVENNNIIMGGVGGISKVIHAFFPNFLDTSTIVTILMWSSFLIGLIFLGVKFSLKTLPCTIFYPLFIKAWEVVIKDPSLTIMGDTLLNTVTSLNPILAAIFGGLVYGTGAGMIFKVGGSSGGVDIPAAIANKYFGVKMHIGLFVQDAITITLSIFGLGLEPALLGIVLTKIMTSTVDKKLVGKPNLLVTIISNKYEEVNKMILSKINRGVTLIPAQGGYTLENKTQIQAVIDKQDLFLLKKQLREIDPNCFIYICDAHEVLGEGFKSVKGDGSYE